MKFVNYTLLIGLSFSFISCGTNQSNDSIIADQNDPNFVVLQLRDGTSSGRKEKREEVRALQNNLVKLGYALEVDGYYGDGTAKIIESIQRKYADSHSLTINGKIVTQGFLNLVSQLLNAANTTNNSNSNGLIKIGVFGDLNGSMGDPNYSGTVTTGIKNILNNKFELVIGTGDFTSGEDYNFTLPESRFDEMWSSFDQKVLSPIQSQNIPFAPTAGNHDIAIAREKPYYEKFWKNNVPNVQFVSKEAYPFYYSFVFKGVFFISLENVHSQKLRDNPVNGVTQRQWIKNQLNTVQAKNAVARIVYGHIPLYPVLSKEKHGKTSGDKYYAVLANEQQGKRVDALEDLLKNGNVDLAVFGHSHAYYPGVVQHQGETVKQSLKILQMPCLGDGNRFLDQRTTDRAKRGYGEILIDPSKGLVNYSSYDYNGAKIQESTLPEKISPYDKVDIHRFDLVKKQIISP